MQSKKNIYLWVVASAIIVLGALVWAVSQPKDKNEPTVADNSQQTTQQQSTTNQKIALPESNYLKEYSITDEEYGTQTTVTIANSERVINTNELPNHNTGDFPNSGNPNSISAQNTTRTYPLVPTLTQTSKNAREPGVAINGVKFEPGTAERATCDGNITLNIEAIQSSTDLGLDFNQAHVQPTGAYHYHGQPTILSELYDTDDDLVHVGFAADGHLIYISKSNAYTTSYKLSTESRSATNCIYNAPPNSSAVIDETSPAGTFTQDYSYIATHGDLDECNGTTVAGQYIYVITDEFPFIGRCLMGSFTETTPAAPPGSQAPPR